MSTENMIDKKRVKITFTSRNEGESAKTTSVILQSEYDIDEPGEWECQARDDFWSMPIWNKRYAVKVEIREIVAI